MPLPSGSRIGPYEIVAPLGAGGMGEVYRATDSNLKRSVAIKVLPAVVAADADRLTRFQREAEVLAALNHPNIAAIYGLEKAPDFTALVMELVEGEDLSQRIARGAIPLDDALPIARQIAEALEAAHELGIVHRDLKPQNIKVRADGAVKVLDFGLAKALDQGSGIGDQGSAHRANSPTITTPAMTAMGMILGTAAYMAPEQARGKPVDKRADIWAFGAVLHEMLTGRRLFDAEDISETLAAVLTRDVSLRSLPAGTPPRLRALLRDCLVRDSKQRLRDIGEVRRALDTIITGAPDETVATMAATTAAQPSAWSRALPAVTALLVGALGVALWAPWRSEQPVEQPLIRLDVDLGADVSLAPVDSGGGSIVISPDGTRLVYSSGSPARLFTRRLDQRKADELPGTEGAAQPFFSRDGQWVAFLAKRKLNKISVEGGAVVPLGDLNGMTGASWGEDDSILVSEGAGRGLLQFPAAGGAPRIVAPPNSDGSILDSPQLLPGGRAILFAAIHGRWNRLDSDIGVMDLSDGRRKILARGGSSPRYVPAPNGPGHVLYVQKATLFALPFDPATLETRGTATPVLDDVAYSTGTGIGRFDASRTGTVIYRRFRAQAAVKTTLQWVDSTGKREPLPARPAVYRSPRISPDGRRIALGIRVEDGTDIWVHDPQREAQTRLTVGGASEGAVWSPDGQYVVFERRAEGIFQARVDGARPPEDLTGSKTDKIPWSFTSDGKRLAYFEGFLRTPQIWTVPLQDEGGQLKAGTPEPFVKSRVADTEPSFSPDGRWLAYHSAESGTSEVYVRAFPQAASGQNGKWPISNNGGREAHWSRTGHELIYRSGDQLMSVSYSVKGDTFVAEKPRVWIAALGGTDWDLAPDGKRVVVVVPEAPVQAPEAEHQIVILLNFADELRRKVPVKK